MYINLYIINALEQRIRKVSSHQVGVQMKGRGQMPGIVLLCRPTIHHKEANSILKVKSIITNISFCSFYSQKLNVSSSSSSAEYVAESNLVVGLQDLSD